jgi:alkaline phosphatase D
VEGLSIASVRPQPSARIAPVGAAAAPPKHVPENSRACSGLEGRTPMTATSPMKQTTARAALCLAVLLVAVRAFTQTTLGYPRVMQGPMVGAVTDTDARIWVRLSGEYSVTVDYGRGFELSPLVRTEPIVAMASNDYTAVVTLGGLEPDTEYFYRINVNGVPDRYLRGHPPFRFRTAPEKGRARTFRVAFGSCPRFQDDRIQPIWGVVEGLQPDLFLWIGDNVYADSLDPEIQREEHRRQRDVAGLQGVLHNISHLAVWDDHDFGLNNSDRTNPIRSQALEVFRQYWANPAYGLPDAPGVFFNYGFGAVDFFFLDGRFYRDPDTTPVPGKTMLGERQFSWLQAELKKSTAVFKVLVSGSAWSVDKGVASDSWTGSRHERDRLFDFIRDNGIGGVILVSGDLHVGELNAIPWSQRGGYDLYDLISSPLAQKTPDSWLEQRPEHRIRPVYFQGSNVGVIDFVFDGSPRVIYRLFDIHGRSVWAPFVVHARELVNGVTSWPDKVDAKERQRQENWEAGKGYYEIRPPG